MFVPSFVCKYCGVSKEAFVEGELGVFTPCQCDEARKEQDRAHYLSMERKKKLKRGIK